MRRRRAGRPHPAVAVLAAAALAVGCAAPPPAAPPAPPPAPARRADLVVLLQGPTGLAGAVVVREGGREIVLDSPYASARTGPTGLLEPGQTTPVEIQAIFAEARAAEPPRPVTFVLYFVEATDQFTPDSQALVEQVLATIAARPAPEITVTGHTDAVGSDAFNDALSLRRAERVRALLVDRGIAPAGIEAVGRGRREPRVSTPAGVPEPRNRRVEITVR